NADGGRLEILDEVGLDDAYTSYVQGNATGLNLGVLLKEDGNLKEGVYGRETVLSITDLDNVDEGDAVGGMAFTTIAYNQFSIKSGSQRRYFAGLLNNVDLGTTFAPLEPGAPTTTAIWNARFYAVVGTTSHHADTTMIVNFNDSSLKTRDDDAPVVLSGGAGNIIIDADFTSAGVIFGTSRWTSALGTKSSEGSVTGLIGTKGAIGAFLSSGENTNSEYAGGFVAAPVDCTQQTGDPFYRLCDASIDKVMMAQKAVCDADLVNAFDPKCAPYATVSQKTMFAETCRMEPLTTGCDRVIVDSPRLTINDCTDSDTGNPYKAECGVDFGDIFAAERTARTLSCKGNDVYNASQCSEVLGNCFDSVSDTGCDTVIKLACDTNLDGRCGAQVPMICGDDPLSIVCETGYEAERQAECSGQDIAML
ncbi:MAG: hypothetical protein K8953_08275, partial [Proteobacteria bacterium]|nr:hypothetical protein [Pseudomonadota bacterium]